MTYQFLVRDIALTIWVEGPYNPEKAASALRIEYEIPDTVEVVFSGTIGTFIPNLYKEKAK